jgi:hypothetical protein
MYHVTKDNNFAKELPLPYSQECYICEEFRHYTNHVF